MDERECPKVWVVPDLTQRAVALAVHGAKMIGNELEHAINSLAVQHILVRKGVCTYEELLTANNGARVIMESIGQQLAESEDLEQQDVVIDHIKRMVEFIGGSVDAEKLKEVLK